MKPILFNTRMVEAILSGEKTTTRRLIKPQPIGKVRHCTGYQIDYWAEEKETQGSLFLSKMKMPYQPGDVLYVRETWMRWHDGSYQYRADVGNSDFPWKPSIHMPKEAARLFLKVKSIEAQRLQDFLCCRSEIIKEGIAFKDYETAKKCFKELWDSTLPPADKSTFGFDANPWVWAIEFERCEKPKEGKGHGEV